MEILENIAEYYDELFPVAAGQREFYAGLASGFRRPVRYLRLGCGTGAFEHLLSQDGSDVTGVESVPQLLESANRRRRTQLMAMRFFYMTNLEIARYLGKGFYNIISILDGRIIFTHDPVLLEKLFFDCRSLLSGGGRFVVSLPDFGAFGGAGEFAMPVRRSIRAELSGVVRTRADGTRELEQRLETGSGRVLTVTEGAPVCTPTRDELSDVARRAGFSSATFSDGFDGKGGDLVAVFS